DLNLRVALTAHAEQYPGHLAFAAETEPGTEQGDVHVARLRAQDRALSGLGRQQRTRFDTDELDDTGVVRQLRGEALEIPGSGELQADRQALTDRRQARNAQLQSVARRGSGKHAILWRGHLSVVDREQDEVFEVNFVVRGGARVHRHVGGRPDVETAEGIRL